jgi:hypothetical protein
MQDVTTVLHVDAVCRGTMSVALPCTDVIVMMLSHSQMGLPFPLAGKPPIWLGPWHLRCCFEPGPVWRKCEAAPVLEYIDVLYMVELYQIAQYRQATWFSQQ